MSRKTTNFKEMLEKPLLNADEFRDVLGVSRGTFVTLKKEKRIPPPLELGPRSNRWSTKIVMAFLEGRAV